MSISKFLLLLPVALPLVMALIIWRRQSRSRDLAKVAEPRDAAVGSKGKSTPHSREKDGDSILDAFESGLRAKAQREWLARYGALNEVGSAPITADGHGPEKPGLVDLNPSICESISVVLRRQVPVRFDEPSRSWLGGLPSMPEGIEWPRGANCPDGLDDGVLRPLHFAAQIACSDLPADLWAGLGPREGWLLFFIGANAHVHDDDSVRVIHTLELGRERQPPADLDPLSGLTFTYGRFRHWVDPMAVPRQWVRWPVDLVVVPNMLHIVDGRESATPENFAKQLYDGLPVQTSDGYLPRVEPFTWGCLRQAWAALVKWLEAPPGEPDGPNVSSLELLLGMEELSPLLAHLHAKIEKAAAALEALEGLGDEASVEGRSRLTSILETDRNVLEKFRQILPQAGGGAGFANFFEAQRLHLARWRERTLAELSPVCAHMSKVGWDSPLSEQDWREYRDHLSRFRYEEYGLINDREFGLSLTARTRSAWDQFTSGDRIREMTHEIGLRCYTDPARRHLLPDAAVAAYEPYWRRLDGNRPHRIGGYFDAIQNAPCEGPTDSPLLIQFNSDSAIQWLWADLGAIQMWIATGTLAQGDFSRIDVREEGG